MLFVSEKILSTELVIIFIEQAISRTVKYKTGLQSEVNIGITRAEGLEELKDKNNSRKLNRREILIKYQS